MKLIPYSLFIVLSFSIHSAVFAQENALQFDGTGDYVSVAAAAAKISSASGFSLTAWVYPQNASPTYPDFDGFVGFRNDVDADFYILQVGSNQYEARFRNNSGTDYSINSNTLQLNTWSHLAFTYDGSTLKFYVNGSLQNSMSASGSFTNSTLPLQIGRITYSTTNFDLHGKVDEVSLWSKALSASEITCIYNNTIDPASANLELYYKFNQGNAAGSNTGLTSLTDATGSINGVLTGFSLSGSSSNWVSGIPSPFNQVSDTICKGSDYMFNGQSYTSAGTYYAFLPSSGTCDSAVELNLYLDSVNFNVSQNSNVLTATPSGMQYQWVNCNTNYTAISGETSATFTAAANGSYAVVVSNGNCSDTSSCFAVSDVSLQENTLDNVIKVYPEPVNDELHIRLAHLYGNVVVSLLDMSGKQLMRQHYQNVKEISENLQSLPAGTYILLVKIDGQQIQKKIRKDGY